MIEALKKIVGKPNVFTDEPMSNHTSIQIGGCADLMIVPKTKKALMEAAELIRSEGMPMCVIGNGSNLLVGDKGIRGVVVKIAGGLNGIEIEANTITAQSGVLLSRLTNAACSGDLQGVEFLAGIPGTVGGAVYMNAGAYDHEIKEVIKHTTYIDDKGKIGVFRGVREHKFAYRKSVYQSNGFIILESVFHLKHGDNAEIRSRMDGILRKRKRSQPLEFPNAGSIFKRPKGNYAGSLIEQAGLKGEAVGGAKVSEKHCGFIINTGNATASDVVELVQKIQDVVKSRFKVLLEPEIKMIGEF